MTEEVKKEYDKKYRENHKENTRQWRANNKEYEMKEIKAYKLSNGVIVGNKEEAVKRQKEIDVEQSVYDFAEKHGCYECKDQIRDAILENADELLAILKKR